MSDQIKHALVGATVNVKAIGGKPAFTGIVESAWFYKQRGKNPIIYFHVRDLVDGTVWHRSIADMTTTQKAAA